MTGVLCMSLTALSRNWSAVQMATRGPSHQPVHMALSLGTRCLLLLCVCPDQLSCQKTEAFGPGDRCPTSRLSVISAFPVRVGRWEFLDPVAGRCCLRLGVIVWARPRCSKTPGAELLPRGQEKRRGGPVTSTPAPRTQCLRSANKIEFCVLECTPRFACQVVLCYFPQTVEHSATGVLPPHPTLVLWTAL